MPDLAGYTSIVFVDLETTGATPGQDRITEIGIVELPLDGGEATHWSSLVNPQQPIPPFIVKMTGITDAMVSGAPLFADLANEVLARLQSRLFVAHNARFDYGFLRREFERLGIDFRATVLCTVKLSRKLFPQHHKHSLDSLVERHSLDVERTGLRHRALTDADLLLQFWQRLSAQFTHGELQTAVDVLTARPHWPAHLDADAMEELPGRDGVYALFGENDTLLALGRTPHLKQKISQMFAPARQSAKDRQLAERVRRIEWRAAGSEAAARLIEWRWMQRLETARPDVQTCAWALHPDADGQVRPELVSADAPDFAFRDDLFGPFATPKEARKVLQDAARKQQLCAALLGLEPHKPGKPCSALRASPGTGGCRGACIGRETPDVHAARLYAALARWTQKPWPFAGPAVLLEQEPHRNRTYAHLLYGWADLGEVDDVAALDERAAEHVSSDARMPRFDREVYLRLQRHLAALQPLPASTGRDDI